MPKWIAIVGFVIVASLSPATSSAGVGATTDVSSAVGDAVAAWGEGQVGTREIGTSDCSPKIDRWERDMGLKVPPCRVWCGAFVHQAYLQSGVRLSKRLIDPDRTFGDAIAARRGLRQIAVDKIRRGDIVFYSFRPKLRASHLAIARGRVQGRYLQTVEGNTSHAVRLEKRGVKYIVLAARVTTAG